MACCQPTSGSHPIALSQELRLGPTAEPSRQQFCDFILPTLYRSCRQLSRAERLAQNWGFRPFEDFKWIGGIRLAGSLQNSTFVVSHKNLERKVDREWIIERQGNEGVTADLGALTRTHTHAVHYRRTIPFPKR